MTNHIFRIVIVLGAASISVLNTWCQDSITIDRQQTLEEVVVTARMAPYKISKGGVILNISGSELSDVGTCYDVLSQLPSVRIDEGSIEVIGKGSPQIYINGRRMLDYSELQRLSSKDIKSVELIGNPWAKYSADAKSVILIKTIKKQGDGLSGSMQAGARQARYFSHSYNVSLNYRSGGIDVFGSANFEYARRYQKQNNKTTIRTVQDEYLLDADIRIRPVSTTGMGNLGVNWQINHNHSLGMRYEYGATPYSKSRWVTNENIAKNGLDCEIINYQTDWNRRSLPTNSVNLYYYGKINSFTLNLTNDFYSQNTRNIQTITESSNLAGVYKHGSDNKTNSTLWASKGIATYQYAENELEFGYEYTSTDRYDRFLNDNDDLSDADDRIKESTIAGFASVNIPINKVELYAGIRYEHTSSRYYMFGRYIPEQSRRYSRFYPNLDFSFPLRKLNFTLSYTTKTKRPLYSQLSSAVQYDDRFTYETGNPFLTSEIIHDISLAGAWRWIYFNFGYQYDKNAIMSVIKPYEQDYPINLMTYSNFKGVSKYSAVLSISPKIKRWSPRLRLNLMGQRFSISTIEGTKALNTPALFWNIYNTISLGNGFNLSADIVGRTQGDMDVVTLKPSWQINLGITKNLKGWFFQLQGTDIFKTARSSMITYGQQMMLDKWNYSDTQSLRLIIRYSFNTTMSKYKGKTSGQSERNRL